MIMGLPRIKFVSRNQSRMQIVLCAARPQTIIAKWEWPEKAKNRGEPRKMTHSTETESECESCSPGHTGDMPC